MRCDQEKFEVILAMAATEIGSVGDDAGYWMQAMVANGVMPDGTPVVNHILEAKIVGPFNGCIS